MTLEFNEKIEELNSENTVKGVLTASLISGGVRLEGHVETDLVLECDRCVEKYPYHADVDIDEIYVSGSLSTAKELELNESHFVEELRGKKEIDVTDLVYQSIILNIPSKRLCNEECPGSEGLQNMEKPIDPRLEIFKKLSEEHKDNN